MKIIRNTIPVSDVYNQLRSRELTINREYQRSPGLWPENARSYFLDTIINEFPFPKIIIRQNVDLKSKKTTREIIDGQQRLLTIRDFVDNKIKLSKVSKLYSNHYFSDLPEEVQTKFLAYEISSDNILSASEEEVLEIFRRINSYTLPLSKTEQRHATYQGEFKWFISDLTEYFTPFFEAFKTLSLREISRMEDADLLTEITNAAISGVQARSAGKLDDVYRKYDNYFPDKERFRTILVETLEFIKENFVEHFESYKVKSYHFYSIFVALIFNKYGFPVGTNEYLKDLVPINEYCKHVEDAKKELNYAFSDIEAGIDFGYYGDFVRASSNTTQSLKNRSIRVATMIGIFQK